MNCITVACTIATAILAGWNAFVQFKNARWHDARLFCVWAEGDGIAVQNAGRSPVYDVIITAVSPRQLGESDELSEAMLAVQEEDALFGAHGGATKRRDERVKIAIVPPGLHHVGRPLADKRQDQNAYYEVQFRDAANNRWVRDGLGVLHRLHLLSSRANYSEESLPLRRSRLID